MRPIDSDKLKAWLKDSEQYADNMRDAQFSAFIGDLQNVICTDELALGTCETCKHSEASVYPQNTRSGIGCQVMTTFYDCAATRAGLRCEDIQFCGLWEASNE